MSKAILRRGHAQGGFTLLELVAALAIFALLAVMAYGGLGSIIETRRSVGSAQERMVEWQKAIYRLRSDFESAVDRPIRDAFGDLQPALQRNALGGIELTRGGQPNPLQQPRSGMQRVEYLLVDGVLQRRAWPRLDRVQGEEGLAYPMLQGIEEVRWRFLGTEDDWLENWPPPNLGGEAAAAGLPRAVELLLRSKLYGEVQMLFALSPS